VVGAGSVIFTVKFESTVPGWVPLITPLANSTCLAGTRLPARQRYRVRVFARPSAKRRCVWDALRPANERGFPRRDGKR